jgi:probable HAF family extracellular repeat protein
LQVGAGEVWNARASTFTLIHFRSGAFMSLPKELGLCTNKHARMLGPLPGVLFTLAFAVCASAQRAPVTYTVEDRGPSLVRTLVNTPGFNSHGDLAIWHPLSTGLIDGIIFHGSDQLEFSGDKDYSFVYPSDINKNLVVAGSLQKPQDLRFTRAFRWADGKLELLETLGGTYSAGNAMNSVGDIAGSSQLSDGQKHAVVWHGKQPQDLGLLLSGDYSEARDINDSGEVVGEANIAPRGRPKAFTWQHGEMHQLRGPSASTFCVAQALNSQGDVVGSCDISIGSSQGVLWKHGRPVALGTLGDEDAPSTPLDINDRGQIVGSAEVEDGRLRAFLWQNHKMYDLNRAIKPASGWLLLVASRVNNNGEIAGRGFYQGGVHAFVLHPSGPGTEHKRTDAGSKAGPRTDASPTTRPQGAVAR